MGKVLQIRVSAVTYDEDEVVSEWPVLADFVWGELDCWGPRNMKRGVAELAEFLPDALRFASIGKDVRDGLLPFAESAKKTLESIRESLAAWNPREAHRLSFELEEKLSDLEDKAAELSLKRASSS